MNKQKHKTLFNGLRDTSHFHTKNASHKCNSQQNNVQIKRMRFENYAFLFLPFWANVKELSWRFLCDNCVWILHCWASEVSLKWIFQKLLFVYHFWFKFFLSFNEMNLFLIIFFARGLTYVVVAWKPLFNVYDALFHAAPAYIMDLVAFIMRKPRKYVTCKNVYHI